MRLNQAVAVVAVIAAVGLAIGGLSYYYSVGINNQVQQDKTTITDLQDTVSALQTDVSSLQGQLSQTMQSQSTQSGQIATLQTTLQSVSSQLTSVNQELNTATAADASFQSQVSAQLQSINASLAMLSTKVTALTPQVPLSTLVVTGSSYNNVTAVYTFQVQNTQTFTVYAQLGVSFYGPACEFYAGEGSYTSQVYSFSPGSNTTVTLNLKDMAFSPSEFCGKEPIAYFSMSFAASSTTVSPSYQFDVLPNYQF